MLNTDNTPVILVARGCLAPYFLNWWKARTRSLYLVNYSRWRRFEFGDTADPAWIGPPPPAGPVILFDRNTTTGQTIRHLRDWLTRRKYRVTTLGHMDQRMGRFGLQFLDYIWDDDHQFSPLGLGCSDIQNVRITARREYRTATGGTYTFCVLGNAPPEQIAGFPVSFFPEVSLFTRKAPSPRSVLCSARNWQDAMLLAYINEKPLITLRASSTGFADYCLERSRDVQEVIDFLAGEKRNEAPDHQL